MKSEFQQRATQKAETDRPNLTGIPTQMKLNFEQHSGISFDDVRVHYGSDRPAQLRALAYTQGRHVYIGPGQERHLGHELGHVIQQKLGQVAPTGRVGGLPLNDDRRLEAEADRLAGLADRRAPDLEPPVQRAAADPSGEQGVVQREVHTTFLNTSYTNANTSELGSAAQEEVLHQFAQILDGKLKDYDHAAILRASLVGDCGIRDPKLDGIDNQAHHIVETNNNPLGQEILRNAGIHPDSSINGVLLPSENHDDRGNASIHKGSHDKMYGICVTIALWNAVVKRWRATDLLIGPDDNNLNKVEPSYIHFDDAPTIIKTLSQIRQMLLEKDVPLNNSADGTYDQGDTPGEQIWNAFRNFKLL